MLQKLEIKSSPSQISPNPFNKNTIPKSLKLKEVSEDDTFCYFSIYKSFLRLGYFHGIIPFTFESDHLGKLTVKSGYWIKLATSIVMMINIGYRFFECWDVQSSSHGLFSPPNFFKVFYGYCNIVFNFCFWYTVFQKEAFFSLFKFVEECPSLPKPPTYIAALTSVLKYIFWILVAILPLISVMAGSGVDPQIRPMLANDWTFEKWFVLYISKGRRWMSFRNGTGWYHEEAAEPFSVVTSSVFDMVLGSFMIFSSYIRLVQGFFEEYITAIPILETWFCAASFANQVENIGRDREYDSDFKMEWAHLKRSYLALKELVDLVNNTTWLNLLAHTFLTTFFYSFSFDTLLLTEDLVYRLRILLYSIGTIIIYFVSADICAKVNGLERWISKVNLKNEERLGSKPVIPYEELAVVLHELQMSRVGISCGVFTITYGMMTSIAGVVTTYFILMLQF